MEKCDDQTRIAIPYVVRGMAAYTKRCQRRCGKIMRRWREADMNRGMMIRVSPRLVGSIWQIHEQMKEAWPRFCNFLRGNSRTQGNYLWAVEPNERHYPHYHMLLGRLCSPAALEEHIYQWWKRNGFDIEPAPAGVKVEVMRGDGKSYALKYVTKGSNDPVWSAMLWLSRTRSWGASRGLADPLINSQPKLPRWTPATCGPIFIDRTMIPNWRNMGIIDGEDVVKYLTPPPNLDMV